MTKAILFNEDAQFYIVADDRYYATKQGLPDRITYEQTIAWVEDKELATLFTSAEAEIYYNRFKETIGKDHQIDVKEYQDTPPAPAGKQPKNAYDEPFEDQ